MGVIKLSVQLNDKRKNRFIIAFNNNVQEQIYIAINFYYPCKYCLITAWPTKLTRPDILPFEGKN